MNYEKMAFLWGLLSLALPVIFYLAGQAHMEGNGILQFS